MAGRKILASAVCRPDVTVRRGEALYSGTPLGQKIPFVPGYAVIGDVETVGEGVAEAAVGNRVGVLTVVGGYSEYVYCQSDRLIPVPTTVDPSEAVTLILNYIVAYQALHRSARVKAGEKVLIIGASGGLERLYCNWASWPVTGNLVLLAPELLYGRENG